MANEIAQTLLKKPQHRDMFLQSMSKAFASLQSKTKVELIMLLDSWLIVTNQQLKVLLEQASLSDFERNSLKNIIGRVGAFKVPEPATPTSKFDDFDEDIPFWQTTG